MNRKIILIAVLLVLSMGFVSAEIVDRGSNWNKYDNGTITYYSGDVNYWNGTSWIPKNLAIIPSIVSGYDYEMTKGYYQVYFKNNSKSAKAVTFQKDGYNISLDISTSQLHWYNSLLNAIVGMISEMNPQSNNVTINDNIATYPNAWINTNLSYVLSLDTLKETLIIANVSKNTSYADYLQYVSNIYFNNSLQICYNSTICQMHPTNWIFATQGTIDFKDSNNITIFYLPVPYLYDSNGSQSLGTYAVSANNGIAVVNIRIPKSFIDNSIFPIFIDPSIKINGSDGGDAYVASAFPNTNYGSSAELDVKGLSTIKLNSYLNFNISSIPINQAIDAAALCLYMFSDTGSHTISAYHVYSNWTESTITWNNQPCGTNFDNSANCNLTAESSLSNNGSQDGTWQCWNVKNMIEKQYTENNKNISVALRTEDNINYMDSFYSKEYSNSSLWPYINITYHILDSTAPNLTIISPLNQTYNNTTILVNISAQDANLQATWWYNGSVNLTYTSPIYYTFPQGSSLLIAYANDTLGNINSSSISFYIDSIAPALTIISPEAKTYGYNISLILNFSVSDSTGISSCWYNLDNSNNITLGNCQNTTFNSSNGSHTLYLYANDSLGNTNSSSISFSINTQIAVSLVTPENNAWLNYSGIEFNYTVNTAIPIKNCSLFINNLFNELNPSPINTSGGLNTIFLSLPDGSYIWNILCSDTYNSFALYNYSLNIDTSPPQVAVTEPTGAKTSRTIQATWTVSDTNLQQCWYNVYRGASLEISDEYVDCNSSSTVLNVTVDADFTFNFYANDSAGNVNSASSSFTVSTSTTPPSGNTGSPGGGSPPASVSKLQISNISNLIINPGETKKMTLNIKNAGKTFLNNCKLKSSGEFSSWISSQETKGLSAGEVYDFLFTLNVPDTASPQAYNLNLLVQCDETKQSINFSAEIIEKKLQITLVDVKNNNNQIKVSYSLEELSNQEQNIEVQILLLGENNEKISETTETRKLEAKSKQEFESALQVSSSLKGTFNLLINANSNVASAFVQEEVILKGSPVGGLAVLLEGNQKGTFFSIVLVAVFILFAVLVIRRIIKFRNLHKVAGIQSNVTSIFPHSEKHY